LNISPKTVEALLFWRCY